MPAAAATVTPVSQASTSTRGVTAHSINVVFPVVSLNCWPGRLGFAADKEYGEQTKAIHLYVNQINQAGGIHGRKINPIIANFDPTNGRHARALCKQWTEGSPAAFAVVDGIGTLDGGQPAVRHPGGAHTVDRRLDHGHQLDHWARPTCGGPGADQAPVLRPSSTGG